MNIGLTEHSLSKTGALMFRSEGVIAHDLDDLSRQQTIEVLSAGRMQRLSTAQFLQTSKTRTIFLVSSK